MPRNPNGHGSVFRLRKKWCVQLPYTTKTGEVKYRRKTFHALADAEAYRRSETVGTSPTGDSTTLNTLSRLLVRNREYAPQSVQQLEMHLRLTGLGDKPVESLTPLDCEKAIHSLDSPSMRFQCYNILNRILRYAKTRRVIRENVMDLVDRPKYETSEMAFLDSAQASEYIKAALEYEYGLMCILALTAGLRRGEIIGLQVGDVDLDRNTISVRRTAAKINKQWVIKAPKTRSSRRTVPVGGLTVTELEEVVGDRPDEAWLFEDADGPMPQWNVTRLHDRILQDADLPSIRFHDLRHSHAVICLEAGGDLKAIQNRLGHRSFRTTADTYAHVSDRMQESLLHGFESALLSRHCQEESSTNGDS